VTQKVEVEKQSCGIIQGLPYGEKQGDTSNPAGEYYAKSQNHRHRQRLGIIIPKKAVTKLKAYEGFTLTHSNNGNLLKDVCSGKVNLAKN